MTSAPLLAGVAPDKAQVLCVFVHGRGQSPEAMEEAVIRRLSTPGVACLLPRAATGSWYGARAVDPLNAETRGELAASLAELARDITALRTRAAHLPLLLAGFSQGACLALEHAFAAGPWSGALAAFTGCRVGQVQDTRPAADLTGLPVYLSGGDADPWIPVSAFAEAAAALGHAHARLRADIFPDRPHEVSAAEIAILDGMLADLAAGRHMNWSR